MSRRLRTRHEGSGHVTKAPNTSRRLRARHEGSGHVTKAQDTSRRLSTLVGTCIEIGNVASAETSFAVSILLWQPCVQSSVLKIGPISTRTVWIPLQSSRTFFYAYILPVRNLWTARFLRLSLFFTTTNKKEFCIATVFLDTNFMRQLSRRCRHRNTAVATLTARWRYGTRSRAVAMSKSRPDVSKMTHG